MSFLEAIGKQLPDYAHFHLPGALAGDIEASLSLMVAAPNEWRGLLARAAWQDGVPHEQLRAMLGTAWDHDHRFVIHAAETRSRLIAMFRAARFPVPPDLPASVPIWRGASGADRFSVANGYSWTLDRRAACWFAIRFASPENPPMVLKRIVRRQSLIYYSNERNEAEVIPAGFGRTEICGEPDEWRTVYDQYEAEKNRRQTERITRSVDCLASR